MHADSIPISRPTPAYPEEEIVQMTNCTMLARICSVTEHKYNRPPPANTSTTPAQSLRGYSAKGAPQSQPRATPWVESPNIDRGLKARRYPIEINTAPAVRPQRKSYSLFPNPYPLPFKQ